MGRKNDAIVPFLKDKIHFADLLNGSLFNGEQVIASDELELLDGTYTTILQDKRKSCDKSIQRHYYEMEKSGHVCFVCL